MPEWVFKVLTASEWSQMQLLGEFSGGETDISDGYIHLSTEAQFSKVVERYYQGIRPLYVIALPTKAYERYLRWEEVRKGESFPHLYDCPLRLSDAHTYRIIQ